MGGSVRGVFAVFARADLVLPEAQDPLRPTGALTATGNPPAARGCRLATRARASRRAPSSSARCAPRVLFSWRWWPLRAASTRVTPPRRWQHSGSLAPWACGQESSQPGTSPQTTEQGPAEGGAPGPSPQAVPGGGESRGGPVGETPERDWGLWTVEGRSRETCPGGYAGGGTQATGGFQEWRVSWRPSLRREEQAPDMLRGETPSSTGEDSVCPEAVG